MNADGSLGTQEPTAPGAGSGTDPLAVTLAAYRQVLGSADVGPADDFFELGGDSIQAIDAVSIIEAALGAEISPALFFTYPTAAELAAVLSVTGSGE